MVKVAQKQTHKSSALVGQSKGMFFIVAGLIVLATLGVYWQVRDFNFISFDDNIFVYENSYVKNGLTAEGIKWGMVSQPVLSLKQNPSLNCLMDSRLIPRPFR